MPENQIRPALPYTRPKSKEGLMKKTEFVYDEHYDCYLCPGGQELPYRTTTKEGYRQYVSNPLHCKECPLLSVCTKSKNHQKLIQRHVWEEHVRKPIIFVIQTKIKRYMPGAKRQSNESLRMQKKSMVCDGQP